MKSVIVRSSDIVAELPLVNEILNFILELVAVIGIMPYVAVVATILTLVPLCSFLPYREWSSEMHSSFSGLKYLRSVGIKLCVECISR